ncbi:hypothetical protein RQP46_010569 [Phenoliferia psychrophenolica]
MKEWDTSTLLSSSSSSRPNALIILNTPLCHNALFRKIWAAASVRYCADGGANRLHDHCSSASPSSPSSPDSFLPDLIKGDLDSLRPSVRSFYESKGVSIIHDPDQNSTDLGKCIASLVEHEKATGIEHQLVILGGLSGRLDQTIHTIHALSLLAETREFTWAVGQDSLACVLPKGSHEVRVDLKEFGDTCAVLPVGAEAHVVTKGLKWDLGPDSYAYPTSVASCVSSSNHLPEENGGVVEIETDVPIVWTVEKICQSIQANAFDREASALKDPIFSLLCEQSHEYHDNFWIDLSPICAKIAGRCALDPATWPPGTLIPVVLTFDYDYRKDTNRERFTLMDADVPTFAGLLDKVAELGRRNHERGLAEAYVKKARLELAKLGLEAAPPALFAFWFVWRRTDGARSMEPAMRVQGFSRFVGIFARTPEESFDYKREFMDLLGPLPVVPR